ncbi:telomeric repeat binding factor a [Cololabis saira]|uniref:telomeric repeat binding factor a n=1 Tax=Cololabis saira TaxID=129043 RepID=UPI002AD45DF6|nr:telomeric repeat binding factor a [Cololabis saira]
MAAEKSAVTLEPVVNRWIVDFYSFVALEFFRNDRNTDFCAIRDILHNILKRPLESTDDMMLKIRVLQFLSRINEGENLDLQFDRCDQPVTPLESALKFLENMNSDFPIPPEDFERVCATIKEMIVGIFIKNSEFDKAVEVLNKHFTEGMAGKKAVFMCLISEKVKTHEVIKQINFQQFKEEILAFCQRLCSFSVPFLQKAAKRIVEHRLAEQNNGASGIDEEDEPGPSSCPQINPLHLRPCEHLIIQRSRLEAAYKSLSAGSGGTTFSQLEQQVEAECQEKGDICEHPSADHNGSNNPSLEREGLFQRDVCSPMEASPADPSPQMEVGPQTQADLLSNKLFTVARLVIEPDSQPNSQCTATPEDLDIDVRTEEAPQTPTESSEIDPKELECPITERESTTPTRKRPRRSETTTNRASTSMAEVSEDSEDDSLDSLDPVANKKRPGQDLHNQSNTSPRRSNRLSSDSERDSQEDLLASPKSPPQTPFKLSLNSSSSNPEDGDDISIPDSSLETSANPGSPRPSGPQQSSTPHKASPRELRPPRSKWKTLYDNAKESKTTWSDEELYFPSKKSIGSNESSNSGHRKHVSIKISCFLLNEKLRSQNMLFLTKLSNNVVLYINFSVM